MPLVHRYRVFGRGGVHVSLRGSFMSRLWTFPVQADANGRLARKRDSERSSSLHLRYVFRGCFDTGSSFVPAFPVSPASQSLCLDLDAISYGDSDAKPGDALRASPITVISVYSSDSDPDSSEVQSSAGSPSVPGSPTSSVASVCVVESPSHYPTLDEPVELSC